ncbi:MAG: hypothetical protein ACOXZ4_02320 [Sphaerochaetaceae bacterium]
MAKGSAIGSFFKSLILAVVIFFFIYFFSPEISNKFFNISYHEHVTLKTLMN